MPSTWQELLLEEDRELARKQDALEDEIRELTKEKKLKPDEQRWRDEKWKGLEEQRTELNSELLKHRAQGLQEIARRVSKNQVRGIFDKDILVYENERVVLLVDGAIQKILGPGTHTVGGLKQDVKTGAILSKVKLGHAETVDVIFVNLSDIDIRWGFPQMLWTQDGFKVGANGIIRLKISEPDIAKLFANMMDMTAQRIRVEDLRSRVGPELLGSVIAPVMKSYRIDDLWGNKNVIDDCYNGIDTEMRKTLSRWGFELIQFTIGYNFPEEWLKRKEEMVMRPLQLSRTIDEKIKYPNEFWRAEIVATNDLALLKKQYGHEANVLDKKYSGELQEYDMALGQKQQVFDISSAQRRDEYELAQERNEFAQGVDMKRQLDKLKLDRDMAEAQLQQTVETGTLQLAEQAKDAQHKRDVERTKTEQEGRTQTLQVLAQSGSADAIARGLEADTLRKIAELGGTTDAANAIRARYGLELHEEAESKAFKQATDLVGVAKVPPAIPIIVPPSGSHVSYPASPLPQATTTSAGSPLSGFEQKANTCPSCKTVNPPVAKYCTSCGTKL